MEYLAFIFQAVVISLSGVLAPGPITAVTVGKGGESPHAGAKVAVGHAIVEFPLIIAIYFGFGKLLEITPVKAGIGFIGGIFLFWMGLGMLKSVRSSSVQPDDSRSPTVAGIMLSIGNPYFLIWWATVGAFLVFRAVEFGIVGFILFAVIHWLCDLIWYSFLSALSYKGGEFFGKQFQKILFLVCGIFLLFFSVKFVMDAVTLLNRTELL